MHDTLVLVATQMRDADRFLDFPRIPWRLARHRYILNVVIF